MLELPSNKIKAEEDARIAEQERIKAKKMLELPIGKK